MTTSEAILVVTAGECPLNPGVEVRDAVELPAVHKAAPSQQSSPARRGRSVEVEKPLKDSVSSPVQWEGWTMRSGRHVAVSIPHVFASILCINE